MSIVCESIILAASFINIDWILTDSLAFLGFIFLMIFIPSVVVT